MEILLRKLIVTLTAMIALMQSAHTPPKFGGLTVTSVTCQSAFQAPMYDTPSGHMQKGYMDADTGDTFSGDKGSYNGTTTTGLIGAHNLGTTGSWKECTDQNGVTHEVPVTNVTYSDFEKTGGIITSSALSI